MFTIRKYEHSDSSECAQCLYEGFFKSAVTENDMIFLHDYVKIIISYCNFTYVAVADEKVVGLLSGNYQKKFDKKLANRFDYKRRHGLLLKTIFKYLFGFYRLSDEFKKEFKIFFSILQKRDNKVINDCDCELATLTTLKNYRKGLGTALVNQLVEQCREKNVKTIHVFTTTASTYEFYEKFGFHLVWELPFTVREIQGKSLVYELNLSSES